MKLKKRQRKLKTNLQNLNIFPNEEDKKETKNQQWTKTFGKFNIKPKLGQKSFEKHFTRGERVGEMLLLKHRRKKILHRVIRTRKWLRCK